MLVQSSLSLVSYIYKRLGCVVENILTKLRVIIYYTNYLLYCTRTLRVGSFLNAFIYLSVVLVCRDTVPYSRYMILCIRQTEKEGRKTGTHKCKDSDIPLLVLLCAVLVC